MPSPPNPRVAHEQRASSRRSRPLGCSPRRVRRGVSLHRLQRPKPPYMQSRASRQLAHPLPPPSIGCSPFPSLPLPSRMQAAPVQHRCSSERAVGAAACPLPTIRLPRACRRPSLPRPSGWSALHKALMPALLDRLARWKPRASSVSVTLSPRRAPRRANPPREDLVCPCPSDRCETAAR